MKSTIVALLAVAGLASARATPRATHGRVNRYKTEYVRVPKVPHPDRVDVSQVCIDFETSLDSWYYLLAPPWGTTSGETPSQLCVPTSNGAGGGMFVGPEPGPNANSTKIECFFPASGDTPANCDVSLVNGYSLSVTCTVGDLSVGGPFDGFDGSTPCGIVSGVNCANAEGPYASSQGQVSGFFQPAASTSGNNYCIWDKCINNVNDPTFPVSEQITCTIAGGMPAASKV